MFSLATFLYEEEAKTGPLLEIPANTKTNKSPRPFISS
jgi:hypothetical protein